MAGNVGLKNYSCVGSSSPRDVFCMFTGWLSFFYMVLYKTEMVYTVIEVDSNIILLV